MSEVTEQSPIANEPAAESHTPFTLTVDGVTYRQADLENDLTVDDAEYVAGILSPVFQTVIRTGAALNDVALGVTAEFLNLIGGGNLKKILVRLMVADQAVSDDQKLAACGKIPKGVAMAMLQSFFGSIGR